MNTQKWTNSIDQITEDFKLAFGDLTDEQMNWKPDEKIWSIAQNIEHLIIINESYYPIIESVKNGTYKKPFTARFDFLVNTFGRLLLKSVQPDRKRKTKTFSIWKPSKSEDYSGMLRKFETHQEGLKQTIISCENLLDQGVVISSPASKNVVYKLETAFEIILAHERRHLEQAKEVLNNLMAGQADSVKYIV